MGMLTTIFIGYIFDIVGRKKTLFFSTIISSLFMILIPYAAPDVYPTLILIRMGLAGSFQAANCHPLVTDYVKKSSRGKATAFLALGFIVGDLITFGVLFNLPKRLS